jgi:diguanylate cyclase (GGDEF)-like protein/PAS domain S-box-containing protein
LRAAPIAPRRFSKSDSGLRDLAQFHKHIGKQKPMEIEHEKSDGAARSPFDAAVVGEQISLLAYNRLDLPINLVNAGIVFASFWRLYPEWVALLWGVLFPIVILGRFLSRRRYRLAPLGSETIRWGHIFTGDAFATGCLWGLTGSVVLVTPNSLDHIFIVFVLGGMMAGGIVSNSAYMPALMAFTLPTILPVIAVLLTRPDHSQIKMGIMLAVFTVVLVVTGRNVNRSITDNFRLRIAQDILLDKLRVSEAVMAAAQEIAQVGSWEIDLVAKSYVCSKEAYRIFGVDATKSRPSYDAMLARIHPNDRASVNKDIAATVIAGTGRGIVHRLVMDNGAIKHVHELARVIRDADGGALRMIGTVQDITERRIAEDKLMFANVLLSTELEASPDGILVVDAKRKIISSNQRFADIWKIPLADFKVGEDAIVLAKVTSAVKDAKRFIARVQYLYDHPGESSYDEFETVDGKVIDRYTATLMTPAEEYLGRVWFFRDITERKRTANELAYRDRLLHAVAVGTGALIKAESLDQGMPEALRIVGESMQVDRVLVMQDSSNNMMPPEVHYTWPMQDVHRPIDFSAVPVPATDFVGWRAPLKEGRPVISQLATSQGPVRTLLEWFHNQSTLIVPIFVDDKLWGSLGIDSCSVAREWTTSEIDTMKTFGDIVGSLIVHNQTRLSFERSEERFRVLGATAQDAIIIIDGAALIRSWNQAAERILGYSAEEVVGKGVHEFLVPERYREKAAEGMRRFLSMGSGDALGKTTELAAIRKDGTEIAVELSLAGAQVGLEWQAIGILRDITERKAVEKKLQFANILLTTEMEASPDGILVVDAKRKIISSNKRFSEIWKTPPATLIAGVDESVLAAGETLVKDPKKFSSLVESLYNHPSQASHDELEMVDGRFIERHTVMLTAPTGESLGRIWFFRDITEAKQLAARAIRMAHFDVLTGLANRSVFVEALQRAVAKVKRGEKGFAVIYLDLDHFKDVNDTLGHAVGDALLGAVADRLEANTRESDTVARFGGDEFAVIVGDIAEPADAGILAEKLIEALGEPYSILGNEIYSGASIGIDLYGPEARDAEALLSHADVALYRAKSEGRGGYRFFTDAMDREVRIQVSLGTELHEALSTGQLFLLYQPQVAIDSGRITGVEALVRWRHPLRGILGPDIFIPVAEKTGFIVKLGSWVLLTACRQAKAWLNAGIEPIRMAVNLSALQFKLPNALETEIVAILATTGLPPRWLELELTETVLMNVWRVHSDIISRLRHLGVTVAIDDFGTGYSSLDYLRRFPADRIKISQTFVQHLETMPGDASIVKATIGLARELGVMVVAEGVKTREQLELLKGWGCCEVQGFYFAKPLAVEDILILLHKGEILQPQTGPIA